MRKLNAGLNRFSEVTVLDAPGDGGACHRYSISRIDEGFPDGEFGFVNFQKGPMLETQQNGCFMEDLLLIVKDRLEGFQSGDFKCSENEVALNAVDAALAALNSRTISRKYRGVEGRSIP